MIHLVKISSILLILSFQTSLFSQIYNRPVPAELFPYEFTNNGFTGDGYFLATPMKLFVPPSSPLFKSPYPVILDANGFIYWYAKPAINNCLDFKYYPTANLYSYTYVKPGGLPSFLILDASMNPIDTLNTLNANIDVHDIQRAQNGNWILGTVYLDTLDLSGYTFNGIQGSATTAVKGFGYQEFDSNDNLISEWNSNNYIPPTETYDFWGYAPNPFDYCHGNAIEEDSDGNILLSFRHLNAVYKIDRLSGNVIWRLGGNSSDFTFTNDNGFSGQHDIRHLSNGNYTLFDNGNMNVPQKSRGIEYQLDTLNWTATKINEYIHPDDFFATAMGNNTTTPDGYQVLGYGLTYRPYPSATVIDANQNQLVELFFEDSVVSYRFLYSQLPELTRPEISCMETGNGWQLTATTGTAPYLWSTGETTQSISVNQLGTYQVWTQQGMGSIGSQPFIVTDINAPCSTSSIDILSPEASIGTYTCYDLLGRAIDKPEKNTVYIQVWDSGFSQKVVFVTP